LVKALARTWRWQRMLDEGMHASVSEIGDADNISKSYVNRILRLAVLDPRGADGSGAHAGKAGAAAAGGLGGAARAALLVNRRGTRPSIGSVACRTVLSHQPNMLGRLLIGAPTHAPLMISPLCSLLSAALKAPGKPRP
jgi:hypothetical protein